MADDVSSRGWGNSSLVRTRGENPLLSSLRIPELYCPIEPAINPAVDTGQAHNEDWVRAFGLVQGDRAFERFRRAKFGRLIARCYPTATAELLYLILDFNAWLFLLDDVHDESEFSNRSEHMRRIHAPLLAILQNHDAIPADKPVAASLADIWHR